MLRNELNRAVPGRGDAAGRMGQPTRESSGLRSRLRWRAILLILAASVAAALLAEPLEKVTAMTILKLDGAHVLHVLVTVPAAIWVARKVGTAPVLYGLV